jgi:hypothetical protein
MCLPSSTSHTLTANIWLWLRLSTEGTVWLCLLKFYSNGRMSSALVYLKVKVQSMNEYSALTNAFISDKVWSRILELGAANESTTLEIIPTLLGERHNPEVRGSASNIDPSNLALGSVTRSLCQGIVANLLQ